MRLPKFGLNTLFAKIILLTLVSLLLTVFILLYYQYYQQRQVEQSLSRDKLLSEAQNQVNSLKNALHPAYQASATLSEVLSAAAEDTIGQISRKQVNTLLKQVLTNNAHIVGVGTAWEPNAFDNMDNQYKHTRGHDRTGIFIPYWYKGNGDSIKHTPFSNYYIKNFYLNPKNSLEPYVRGLHPHPMNNDLPQVITFSHPIVNKGKFMGVTFVQTGADFFQNTLSTIDSEFSNAEISVFGYDGTILYTSGRPELSGQEGSNLLADFQTALKTIRNATEGIYENKQSLEAYLPLTFPEASSHWQLRVTTTYGDLYQQDSQEGGIIALLIVLLIVVAVGEFLWLKRMLSPLKAFTKNSTHIARGNTDIQKDFYTSTREFKTLRDAFSTVVNYLRDLSNFADELGKENFEVTYEPKSKEDTLGHSLLKLKNNLLSARKHEEERQQEEEKRNWINEGLAKFNEILHRHYESQEEMAYFIIREIIDYVDATQGGLFIYQSEEEEEESQSQEGYLELMASVAYDERKYIKKQLNLGEELAGACALEKKTIYLTDIPEDYVQITSGLGEATPRNLILVPLTIKDRVYGVIELAAFHRLEDYKREFLEKLAESLATTLYSSQINERTIKLLEKSKQQAEEMASQEEEMRQNLEELQATQEDLNKKQKDLEALEKIIDIAFQQLILDRQAIIRDANENFLINFGFNKNEVVGADHKKILDKTKLNEFSAIWKSITQGNNYHGQARWIKKDGSETYNLVTYMPVIADEGTIERIFCISYDITRSHELESKVHELENELQSTKENATEKANELDRVREEYNVALREQEHINQSLKDELAQYKNKNL